MLGVDNVPAHFVNELHWYRCTAQIIVGSGSVLHIEKDTTQHATQHRKVVDLLFMPISTFRVISCLLILVKKPEMRVGEMDVWSVRGR